MPTIDETYIDFFNGNRDAYIPLQDVVDAGIINRTFSAYGETHTECNLDNVFFANMYKKVYVSNMIPLYHYIFLSGSVFYRKAITQKEIDKIMSICDEAYLYSNYYVGIKIFMVCQTYDLGFIFDMDLIRKWADNVNAPLKIIY